MNQILSNKPANIIIVIIIVIVVGIVVFKLFRHIKNDQNRTPRIDPGVQLFLNQLAMADGPPLYTLSPVAARNVLNKLQTPMIESPPTQIQDLKLPVGPRGHVNVRIMRPPNNKSALPIVMYFHGGGWVLGNKYTHDHLIRQFANGAKVAIVFVEYTPSPEGQYPVPIQEAYAATKYMVDHAKRFNLDPSRVAVAGDSVGGNMATVVAMIAKKEGNPKINLQLLLYPVTNADFNTKSYHEFANGPWLTRPAMQWFWDNYLPNKKKRLEPTASPLLAPSDMLKDLPKTLMIVDENDVLRDEGLAYAKRLGDLGIDVTYTRYAGTIHDFMMLNGLAKTAPTEAAIAQAIDFLRSEFTTMTNRKN